MEKGRKRVSICKRRKEREPGAARSGGPWHWHDRGALQRSEKSNPCCKAVGYREARDGCHKVRWTLALARPRRALALREIEPMLQSSMRSRSALHFSIIKKDIQMDILFYQQERETGIEPATPSLARRCSTTEPLAHNTNIKFAVAYKLAPTNISISDFNFCVNLFLQISCNFSATFVTNAPPIIKSAFAFIIKNHQKTDRRANPVK